MSFDTKIFNDKTLSDMFSDVYKNTDSKRAKIEAFLSKFMTLMQTLEDAEVLAPIVKDFLDIQIKNDEHIVRLTQIAQRLVAINKKTDDGGWLSESEKEQLLKNIKVDFEQVLSEQEELEDELQTASSE